MGSTNAMVVSHLQFADGLEVGWLGLEVGCGIGCWLQGMVRRLARIRGGVDEDGESWFSGKVTRKVGDGEATMFWRGRWIGEVPLC